MCFVTGKGETMEMLNPDYIRKQVADTDMIYRRGERLFEYGACVGRRMDAENGLFEYAVDGNYADQPGGMAKAG